MNPTIKKILWPLVLIRRSYDNYLRKHNPEKLYGALYKRNTGYSLDIDNPKNLYEKIAYLSFRTDTSVWSKLADKVAVRSYVKECGFEDNLVKLYGVWDNADDIDFSCLPQSFVIKTNHASATNILVKDKNNIDETAVKKQLNSWLKIDYGYLICEPHYSRICPKILAEEYLIDEAQGSCLIDYKIFCVKGKPKYIQVMMDREPNTHKMRFMTYDTKWNAHPEFNRGILENAQLIPRPKELKTMLAMASKLSAPFPIVRVDFYIISGKPIFGELTFTPGFNSFNLEFQSILGNMIEI